MDYSREGGVLGKDMSRLPSDSAQLEFLICIQRILGEGSFVASYKYALLLTLAELSIEKTSLADGTLPIELDELADRFIALYWRQVAPFRGQDVLVQSTGRQASIISKIAGFKAITPTIALARNKRSWQRLVRDVGRLLVSMPLWKLQLVGRERLEFLYDERLVERCVVLRPGVAACFRAQFAVVQALVQTAWLSFVQRLPLNRSILGSMSDLSEFLFGAERSGLRSIADGLLDLQRGACFYCAGKLRESGEVDHFIPWSRYPLDLGHNFVLAHASCNRDKRDMLSAPCHLVRWINRNNADSATLGEIFDAARFPSDLGASLGVAKWAYENAEKSKALVWVSKGRNVRLLGDWRGWLE